jgi:hypothetical protein
VYESFMKVFRSFYLVQKFRLLLPGAITLALLISVLRAISYPTKVDPLAAVDPGRMAASVIVAGTMTTQYIVLAVSVLFVGLVILLHLPWRVHEYRIVLGFGISALGTFAAGALRSQFPTEFRTLNETLSGVAYTLALVVWITALRHPFTPKPQLIDRGVSPESLVEELRRQVAYTRSLLRS